MDPIISPDTRRPVRLPPNQRGTPKWPVMTAGETPPFDPAAWSFALFPVPLVDKIVSFTWPEFSALPRVKVFADMHCVTQWSKLDNLWEGVPTAALRDHVTIIPDARFVMIHCDYGFTTNLPVEDFFAPDAVFALTHNGEPLTPDHGHPVRLVVPHLFAWKSAKWVRGIEFMTHDRPGYWEDYAHGGYHMRGDPWTLDESGDGQRFRKE